MNCSRCHKSMIILELQGVEIDHCFACGGIWLDRGELEVLLKDADSAKDLLHQVRNLRSVKETRIPCPICRKKMDKKELHNPQRLLIDACRHGHGLWFDRGELQSLLLQAQTPNALRISALLQEMFRHVLTTQNLGE